MIATRHSLRPSLRLRLATLLGGGALALGACSGALADVTPDPDAPNVVVTYSVLGSVVMELVGERANVTVMMGDGVDPHDWSPSARDIEAVMKADLVVANGLDLEESLVDVLEQAEVEGVPVFHATDHIEIRRPGEDDHEGGDPHFWVDPLAMREVVTALADALADVDIDVATQAVDLETRLLELDAETRATLDAIPAGGRKLVTGHESMGYFADRYEFALIGAVVPGLSSQGEVAAGELATLKAEIQEEGVPAIFTEAGTPAAVVEAIGQETGVDVVELPSHNLPEDGSYFSFIREIASAVAAALG